MRSFDVGIIGGGPGGLMTAYALQRLADHPVRVTLFEASSRLGGKILTPTFRAAPVRYEAGAAEFYDYSTTDEDPLKALIQELGLPIRPMGGPAVVMDQQILSNLDDIQDRLGPEARNAFLAFDRMAKDRVTRQEFYASEQPEGSNGHVETTNFDTLLDEIREPRVRSYVETLIHSDLATEPSRTSPTYGLHNYVMNDGKYMQLYGIEGGNERLPQALAARLDATIRLEQPVRSVERRPDGRLRVRSEHAGVMHEDDFDHLVIALPHNRLTSLRYPQPDLADAMARHHAHYNHPAHYLRITLLFDQPFWRGAFTDSYWMLDKLGGCCLYDESSRIPGCTHGILGWLLGGEAALAYSEKSDAELIEVALDSLPDFLGHGRTHMLEGAVHRWTGSVSAMPGGARRFPSTAATGPTPWASPTVRGGGLPVRHDPQRGPGLGGVRGLLARRPDDRGVRMQSVENLPPTRRSSASRSPTRRIGAPPSASCRTCRRSAPSSPRARPRATGSRPAICWSCRCRRPATPASRRRMTP